MKRTVSVASLGSKGCEPSQAKATCPGAALLHLQSSSAPSSSARLSGLLSGELFGRKFKLNVARKAPPVGSVTKATPGLGIIAALEEQEIVRSCVTRSSIAARKSQRVSGEVSERSVSTPSFLRFCSLCKKSIASSVDIFMYRSIQAFCSAECRYQQIFLDEKLEKNEKCSSRSKSRVRVPRIPACKLVA